MRIQAREQAGSRWTTASRVVELGEAKSSRSEGVEIRSLDFAAVAPDVGKTDVIAEDDDEVGMGRFRKSTCDSIQTYSQRNHEEDL
jgi:hypothetical protein